MRSPVAKFLTCTKSKIIEIFFIAYKVCDWAADISWLAHN